MDERMLDGWMGIECTGRQIDRQVDRQTGGWACVQGDQVQDRKKKEQKNKIITKIYEVGKTWPRKGGRRHGQNG